MSFQKCIGLAIALILGASVVSNAQTYVNRTWNWDPADSTWHYVIYPVWYDTMAMWDTLGWENGPYYGGLPFYVEDVVGINQLGTLTIEPGVLILADSNSTFIASAGGTFYASGTDTHPIEFDVSESMRGRWGGFDVVGGSMLTLFECTIQNAGYGRNAVVFADDFTPWLGIDHCRFEYNDPDEYVIQAHDLIEASISNNAFEYNTSGIVYVSAQTAGGIDIGGNSATGNAVNGISVDCFDNLSSYADWHADLPYVLERSGGGYFSLDPDANLVLSPGTVVKFNTCIGLWVNGGAINAQGTPLAHIWFTSYLDDMTGGDTNGDGSQSFPSPGDWSGIIYAGTGNGLFDFCDFAFGGADDPTLGLSGSSHASLSNCRFLQNLASGDPVIMLSSPLPMRDADNSTCSMINTLVSGNSGTSPAIGVYGDNDTLVMFSCLLIDDESGVDLQGGSSFEIHHSDFVSLPSFGLSNTSGTAVNAQFCWWDHPSGPSGIGPGVGTAILGDLVNFVPWKPFGGNQGGGSGVDSTNTEIQGPYNQFADPTEGLGSPDDRWVSLGVGGFVTLDFGDLIELQDGPEFTIFESDSEGGGRPETEAEGFDIFSRSSEGGFEHVDRGTGTETIDMGTERQSGFRYLKVVDDGDGDPDSHSPGYDLDAIYTEYPLPMAKVWVNDSIFPFDDDTVDFGPVDVENTESTRIVVYNLGEDTLSLIDAHLATGDVFFLDFPLFPLDIVYDAPYVFGLSFTPNSTDSFTDDLIIVTDDAWEDTVDLKLFGQGVPTGVAENRDEIPDCDFLRLEGPLPCGNKLSLTYGLRDASKVEIRLYNVLGQCVDVVLQGRRQAGLHRMTYSFDENLPGGTYFLEMDAGRNRQVQKIVVR